MARSMATLVLADHHPTGGPKIWYGNRISASISSLIPIQLDEDACPLRTHAFPASIFILKILTLLWDHGIHDMAQIIGRTPKGHPYFLDDRELQWANPSMGSPLPQDLTHAQKYLRTLLSSKSPEDWRLLKPKISGPQIIDLSIAPHGRDIFTPAWGNLPNRLSPLAGSGASQQPTITEGMGNIQPPTSQLTDMARTRIILYFKTRRKKGPKRNPASKRKPAQTVEPL